MCFSCKGNHLKKRRRYYYYCTTCNLEFHRGCHLFHPEIRHPFHPSHPLTLISLPPKISKIAQYMMDKYKDYEDFEYYDEYSDDDDGDVVAGDGSDGDVDDDDDVDDDYFDDDDDDDDSLSDGNHLNCKCCRVPLEKLYYHCSICKFNLNTTCSMKPPPATISHLKSHEHILTLFPIRLPLPCDACGLSLSNAGDLVYACLPCSHMVQRSCIYLPRVIKVTRHPHRLSLTSSLQPGDFSCGVCRQTVDVNYGQYSCDKGCHYAIHSKCATREDVWDGKDLDGVPEEPDEYIEPPFLKIDEETIQHFSHHEHYLRLHEHKTIGQKDKLCEACTLPIIISQRFYSCMQCDYVLDEACASLPRKKYLPLHKHPLTLHPFPIGVAPWDDLFVPIKDLFVCNGCNRKGCGFVYKCDEEDCNFNIDVRCASVPDPLTHGCHPHDHPLFFNLSKGNCMGCGSESCSSYFLECIKCKSFLGIRCATLPSEAHYRHDRHPLTLCYGEEDTTSGQYWCEKCESKLDPRTWFYTCDSCRITLHVDCLLGYDIYMKPHHVFRIGGAYDEVEIARNDGNSRLFCYECNRRCAQTLVFKCRGENIIICTLRCLVVTYYG